MLQLFTMKETILKVTPLGGAGQIGANMTLINTPSQTLLIDAGILFPNNDSYGINYLIPDLSTLPPPDALIITHGHEDHIGAVAHVVKHFPKIKIFAPRFAAALIRRKLNLNKLQKEITIFEANKPLVFADMQITPLAVNHSIPQTHLLLLEMLNHPLCLCYASDFKADQEAFKALSSFNKNNKYSKRILCADSTNILSEQRTRHERDLVANFEQITSTAPGRLFITLFASNIERIQNLVNLGAKFGKPVIPYGRSMNYYIETAIEENLLSGYEKVIKRAESVANHQNSIILVSGCQGEFRGCLGRIANNADNIFKPHQDDTFVFSSKAIPGNEKNIAIILNRLSATNCKIITQNVHVSGHPGPDDLKELYNAFCPTDIIPLHGEYFFLQEHISFINKNFPDINAHLLPNNYQMIIEKNMQSHVYSATPSFPIAIHGNLIPIEKEHINMRRKMAQNGAVFISILDKDKINYRFLGLPNHAYLHENDFLAFLKRFLIMNKRSSTLEEQITIAVRQYWNNLLGYRPTTVIHLQ